MLQEEKVEDKNNENPYYQSRYNSIEIPEEATNNNQDMKKQFNLLMSFIKLEEIYKPVIFILIYSSTPSFNDPVFYFYTNELKFTPIIMGRLSLMYGIANILGIWLYNKYFKEVSFKKIMFSSTILSLFFNMMTIIVVKRYNLYFGIPDFWFCLATDSLTTALAQINLMPLLVLACNICPKDIEGTLYAFIMSVSNFGGMVSSQSGAVLSSELGITANNFSNLWLLVLIANLALIIPLPALTLINKNSYINKEEKIEETDIKVEETIKALQGTSKIIVSKKPCNSKDEEDCGLFSDNELDK